MLIATVLILMTIGVVMLASASMVKGAAEKKFHNDPVYFVKRQMSWMVVAIIAAVACSRINLCWLRKMALPTAGLCALLLVLTRIPGIGLCINGSWRWLRFGPLIIQPSELTKVGIILSTAWWISLRRRYMHIFCRGILVPMIGLGFFAALLIIEPDFGTTLLVSLVTFTLLYTGGARPSFLLGFTAVGITTFALLLARNANRMRRIFAFLHPEKYARKEAWQLINALDAFAVGGPYGTGLGNSIQKYHYLPEPHTDFILPILGEEFGLISTFFVLLLFVVLFTCGLRIAAHATDNFGRFTALGCTLMITLQALVNIAVVTGSIPTKGLALPFISYGGSSLLVSSAMIGILINIAHTSQNPKSEPALFKDKRRRA